MLTANTKKYKIEIQTFRQKIYIYKFWKVAGLWQKKIKERVTELEVGQEEIKGRVTNLEEEHGKKLDMICKASNIKEETKKEKNNVISFQVIQKDYKNEC